MTREEVIALALAVGGASYFRPNNWAQDRSEVEAYLALVDLLGRSHAGVDARMMEAAPGSEERRALLAEQVRKSGAADSRAVMRESRRVLEEALEHAPSAISAVLIDQDAVREALVEAGRLVEEKRPAAGPAES